MKCNAVFYVISAFRPEYSEAANRARHDDMLQLLTALEFGYTVGEGSYQGDSEDSILVQGTEMHSGTILRLAERYGQDCILKVYSDNSAFFVNSERSTKLGYLRKIDSKPKGDYSKFNGIFFQIQEK